MNNPKVFKSPCQQFLESLKKFAWIFFLLHNQDFRTLVEYFLTHHKKEVADILYIATVITHVCVFAALQDFTALKLFSNPVIFLYPSGGVLKSSSSTEQISLLCHFLKSSLG